MHLSVQLRIYGEKQNVIVNRIVEGIGTEIRTTPNDRFCFILRKKLTNESLKAVNGRKLLVIDNQ